MNEATLKDARILIADDEVGMSCLVSSFLNRLGFNKLRRVNRSALIFAEIEAFQPDLMLLDLMMPGMNGFQVLERLRKGSPFEKALPVLVLTGETAPEHKRRAFACGATDLINKPFDASEFAMRVRNLLEARFCRLEVEWQNQMLEQRVAERTHQLEQAMVELKEAQGHVVKQGRLHAFAEMAGGIVHDFSNALMSVVGYSDILIRDPSLLDQKDVVLDYLTTMNTAGRDAAQVVSRLRDFYRPREDDDVFESTDLNKIVEETIALTQPRWRTQALGSGRAITVAVELEKIPAVSACPTELREVLTNLIFNAVDAMPEGGTITLRSRREAAHVVLEVSDSGTGMTTEVLERCVEPFFTTKGDAGTGLGLSMVFGVVSRHEGTVEIESEVGAGTTFRLQFPSLVPRIDAPVESVAPLTRSLNILVVDDQDASRNIIARYLTGDGHRVATACNGYEAMRCMGNDVYDVVMTDLGMPGMTGAQLGPLAKKMRANQPVILFTGNRDIAGKPKAGLESGMDGIDLIMHKPVPHSALVKALETVMAGV